MAGKTHFIGIGGAGMSAIAHIMHHRGQEVSGSDQRISKTTDRLKSEGISVVIGHDPASVHGASLVVYSAAVPSDNPELVEAERLGIPILTRAQMLGRLMEPYKHRVAVTGTHGKTTTTSMVHMVLSEARLDPTVLIGGDLDSLGGNAKVGGESVFVTEACEAFNSFLDLHPSIAIITNIDADHLDYHKTLDRILESFGQFVQQVDEDGCVIACMDDENAKKVLSSASRRVVGYSAKGEAEVQAVDIFVHGPQASYELVRNGEKLGRVTLGVPGMQNVENSLAAAALGFELGASVDAIRHGLSRFKGTGRRFEMLGVIGDIMVVDDYAHHPREIQATLSAARAGWNRRIIAVFQPHLYSRTQFFAKEFAESLSAADVVIVTDIYAAREKPIEGVTPQMISDQIQGPEVHYIPDKDSMVGFLLANVRPGDMVITLGAGDIRVVGEELISVVSGVKEELGTRG
ncbi:MAG TPA: UDP-N-acetylmuramate--L-alanine ligase [Armatimonadota bacterium]|nr:UDP-N-acetylmuramate--L-alanine ligase [Armatimonadota bacterium]